MIRRLLEAHFVENRNHPTSEQVLFWLRQSRTPSMLVALVKQFHDSALQVLEERPLLESAFSGDESELTNRLEAEEKQERELDRLYWLPLRRELEKLRPK